MRGLDLRNPVVFLQEKIRDFLKSKSRFKRTIDIATLIIFALLFFSIPSCSFTPKLNIITWFLSGLLLILVFLSFLFFYRIRIDICCISLLLFCFSWLISTALNGFKTISFTHILLTTFTIIIYVFAKENKDLRRPLLFAAYFGTILFLFLFLFTYGKKLLFNSGVRLGSEFGDENDIAIYNNLGLLFSIYFFAFSKNIFVKIFSLLFSLLFLFCGIQSGSKIIVFLLIVVVTIIIFVKNTKKKIWLSFLELGIIVTLGVLILFMPFATSLRQRFLMMINVFIPINNTYIQADLSTIDRMNMFLDGIEMFLRKPLFGFGNNGFAIYGGIGNGWSHNHISEMLSCFGLTGSILYHIPMAIYFLSKKNFKDNRIIFSLVIVFFLCCMISIALPGEKMFAFLIGIVYSESPGLKDFFIIDLRLLL